MKKIIFFGVTVLLLLMAAVLYFVLTQSRGAERHAELKESVPRKLISSEGNGRRAKKAVGGRILGNRSKLSKLSSDRESDENWSPAEKKLAEELQEALDEEDFAATQRLSLEALKSENPQIVGRAVEALKWFGPKALPELTALAAACADLAAGNQRRGKAQGTDGTGVEDSLLAQEEASDVLNEAYSAIEEKLGEIESDAEKAKLVSQYMKTTSDEDMLTLLEGQLNTVLDEKLVVEAAVDVITTAAGNAVEHAKEAYKFQTGEDYTTPEAAQAWLNENYTPPDQM